MTSWEFAKRTAASPMRPELVTWFPLQSYRGFPWASLVKFLLVGFISDHIRTGLTENQLLRFIHRQDGLYILEIAFLHVPTVILRPLLHVIDLFCKGWLLLCPWTSLPPSPPVCKKRFSSATQHVWLLTIQISIFLLCFIRDSRSTLFQVDRIIIARSIFSDGHRSTKKITRKSCRNEILFVPLHSQFAMVPWPSG